jgi:cytochrome c peroxidase
LPLTDPAIAVAYNPANPLQIVAQTQQPSQLVIIDNASRPFEAPTRVIQIADPATTLDTGAQLFHRDSGGGIACASCHPEGTEDGKVWKFSGIGERRTQALDVGLEGTAPFHWDGELAGVGELMSEVFVARMGGINESPERLGGLERFLFAFRPIARLRDASDEAVGRGQVLFESAETGCTTCHNGDRFTNNRSFDVGTRSQAALQVPSLVGIGYRAPFMHNGCAETLTGRFDPACGGGELHGNTAALSSEEVADLVAYLESI